MTIAITPDEDKVSADLRFLTKALAQRGTQPTSGLLGGEYGYGAEFENEVFVLHPFCWCEQASCPWCLTCECTLSDELEVLEKCTNCTTNTDRAANFLHKATGTAVRWYKYIGRSMTVEIPDRTDWHELIAEYLKSISD